MEIDSTIENSTNSDNADEILCLPGQRLCLSEEATVAGQGTYERGGYIYATLAGSVQVKEKDKVSLNISALRNSIIIIYKIQIE